MIPWLDLPSSYSLDILKKLFKKGMINKQCTDYLFNIQNGSITEDNREKLHTWIFNVCEGMGTTNYTKELACHFTDYFLKTKKCSKSALQLLGISSIQIAIKMNEQFLVDINTLSDLCGNIYTNEHLLKFEEILLAQLEWTPYLPTSFEMLNHMKNFLSEISLESKHNMQGFDCILRNLSEIFKSEEFTHKVAIFIQIAILDYNLSRYGPIIVSMVAALCVLKCKKLCAEYSILIQIILHIFQNENLSQILFEGCRVAADLFGLPISDADDAGLQDILGLIPNHNIKQEESSELNNSMQSDSSQITCCLTTSSSPQSPSLKHKTSVNDEASLESAIALENKKQKCLQKKRKIICKRKLE